MNPHFYIFQYDPKEVKVLIFFFIFGLADNQKSFNTACNNIYLHLCVVIMDLFIILKC